MWNNHRWWMDHFILFITSLPSWLWFMPTPGCHLETSPTYKLTHFSVWGRFSWGPGSKRHIWSFLPRESLAGAVTDVPNVISQQHRSCRRQRWKGGLRVRSDQFFTAARFSTVPLQSDAQKRLADQLQATSRCHQHRYYIIADMKCSKEN